MTSQFWYVFIVPTFFDVKFKLYFITVDVGVKEKWCYKITMKFASHCQYHEHNTKITTCYFLWYARQSTHLLIASFFSLCMHGPKELERLSLAHLSTLMTVNYRGKVIYELGSSCPYYKTLRIRNLQKNRALTNTQDLTDEHTILLWSPYITNL
jgi:hypothetical protein